MALLAISARAQDALLVSTLAGHASTGSKDGSANSATFAGPYGIACTKEGDIYVADSLNNTIRKIAADFTVTTVAGLAGQRGSADGVGAQARFNSPHGIAVDRDGNIFVSDSGNQTIRRILPDGTVTTLAGLALAAGSSDGTGPAARFDDPEGIAVDASDVVWVADSFNCTIRRISPSGAVTTAAGIAGVATSGQATNTDGPALLSTFLFPYGLSLDGQGDLYIADAGDATIRCLSPNGIVTTVAGIAKTPGFSDGPISTATFHNPEGVAVGTDGTIFVVDFSNNAVRAVASGRVTTIAGGAVGSADGTGAFAAFYQPRLAAVDTSGNLIVPDGGNNSIRRVTPQGATSTVTGAGNSALPGPTSSAGATDGQGSSVRLNSPRLAAYHGNSLYVADAGNHTIRVVQANGQTTVFAGIPGRAGWRDGTSQTALFNTPSGIAVDNAGNLFVSDTGNQVIRRIDENGNVTTYAGIPGVSGATDGLRQSATFNAPGGLALAADNTLYVADTGNETIRAIALSGKTSTVAGVTGATGWRDGVAVTALFNNPLGVAEGSDGNLYIADSGNATVRKLSRQGVVSSVAGLYGPSPSQPLLRPTGIALDSSGKIWLVDAALSIVSSIGADGNVSIMAGQSTSTGDSDGTSSNARFSHPQGIAIDPSNGIAVIDSGNNEVRYCVPKSSLASLVNFSLFQTDPAVTTVGFVISGAEPKRMLLRTVGPSLSGFGITGVPSAAESIWNSSSGQIGSSTWPGAESLIGPIANAVGAFPLISGSQDAATVLTVSAGAYTAIPSFSSGSGSFLSELYDADKGSPSRLVNASALAYVSSSGPTVVGFVLASDAHLIVRAIGPSLSEFGIVNGLKFPSLALSTAGGIPVASGSAWNDSAMTGLFSAVGAFPIAYGSMDVAFAISLPAGAYLLTPRSGSGNDSGWLLVELYLM